MTTHHRVEQLVDICSGAFSNLEATFWPQHLCHVHIQKGRLQAARTPDSGATGILPLCSSPRCSVPLFLRALSEDFLLRPTTKDGSSRAYVASVGTPCQLMQQHTLTAVSLGDTSSTHDSTAAALTL